MREGNEKEGEEMKRKRIWGKDILEEEEKV